MIKESLIQKFQQNNKESDIMGVVRTLYPNIEVSIPKAKKSKKK